MIFIGRGGYYIRPEFFFSVCKLAFGDKLDFCPTMVAQLCFGLKEHALDIEGQFKPSVHATATIFMPGSHAIALNFISNKIETLLRATV